MGVPDRLGLDGAGEFEADGRRGGGGVGAIAVVRQLKMRGDG